MIKKANKSFSINVEIQYVNDPDGDEELAKGGNASGSFWQVSISEIKDKEGRILNLVSAYQMESLVKQGGLHRLMKEFSANLPRFIDQNGLPSK